MSPPEVLDIAAVRRRRPLGWTKVRRTRWRLTERALNAVGGVRSGRSAAFRSAGNGRSSGRWSTFRADGLAAVLTLRPPARRFKAGIAGRDAGAMLSGAPGR